MKNTHVIPTDKPSTLFKDDFGKLIYSINIDQEQNHFEPQHIYITSDEEIKEGDWVFNFEYDYIVQYDCKKHDDKFWYKKIILTTDQDLIKDGVQAIDDEFLEWFVKNPSCEEVKIEDYGNLYNFRYLTLIPREEPKQEILEEAASRLLYNKYPYHPPQDSGYWKDMFIAGAKWQQERSYTEEEVVDIMFELLNQKREECCITHTRDSIVRKVFEQFKKK